MKDIVLEVKDVSKIYKKYDNNLDRLKEIFFKKEYHKKFIANKNISFSLFKGETLGIIGINGAGKSTILKIIAGVISPTSGEVIRRGRVTALLELGTGFNDEMTGIDNIFLNGSLIGMTKEEIYQKKEDIIEFSELGEYIREPIKTYSSGMKMRLAFSIAIFSEPEVFIVDEALSVGDAHFQQKCISALKKRKNENMSIIYVSHDLNSLKLLCDRVILLSDGIVIEEGMPEEVINSYNFLISKLNDKENLILKQDNNPNSYGTFDIEIIKATVIGKKSKSNIISSGENATIQIVIKSKKAFKNITIGILIKDRYGQDIYGTNTYYQGKKLSTEADKIYICDFNMPLNIGIGKYTLTAAIHLDENHLEECYHWLDRATEFEVAGVDGDLFIGLCKLDPNITYKEEGVQL